MALAKDPKQKLMGIITMIRDSLSEFSSQVEEIEKASNSFLKVLSKAKKDLKGLKLGKGFVVEETEAPAPAQPVAATPDNAREKAASLLFNMLSGKEATSASPAGSAPVAAAPKAGPPSSGPPSSGPPSGPPKAGPPSSGPPSGPPKAGPPSSGPPSGPPKAGPPSSGPPSGPPKSGSLPPPPKMPPGKGSGPPSGPSGAVKAPSFAKAATPPAPKGPPTSGPPSSGPPKPSLPSTPAATPAPSGGAGGNANLGSLRDEMLKELDRLKKIMRGT